MQTPSVFSQQIVSGTLFGRWNATLLHVKLVGFAFTLHLVKKTPQTFLLMPHGHNDCLWSVVEVKYYYSPKEEDNNEEWTIGQNRDHIFFNLNATLLLFVAGSQCHLLLSNYFKHFIVFMRGNKQMRNKNRLTIFQSELLLYLSLSLLFLVGTSVQ